MNDEFIINKTVSTGSEGGSQTLYNLYLQNHDVEIEEMSMDEIIRLDAFLATCIKKEGGTK
jgi:hypothetical protein|nr:MAG TPA: hypothetical protein [Caudoviricetes sp.]